MWLTVIVDQPPESSSRVWIGYAFHHPAFLPDPQAVFRLTDARG